MGKTILVVDDDVMNLKLAGFILEKKGYEVIKAASGQECLDVLESQSVDMILLDFEMPEMNGIETMEKIQANEDFAKIPVVFLSASQDDDKIQQAMSLGAANYVGKPFVPPVLQQVVADILE